MQAHPDYAPALLNLATVDRQYLRDDAQALKNYRAYLELKPRPADWDAVNDLVNSLEQPAMVAAMKAPPAKENETASSRETKRGRNKTSGERRRSSGVAAEGAAGRQEQSGSRRARRRRQKS